jgi:hypothetical protein
VASSLPPARPRTEASASLLSSAAATWLRYLVPLTALSAVALSPLVLAALRTRAPTHQPGVHPVLALGWTMLATAWLGQLVLVGGASVMTSGRPSQLRAFGGGLVQLVRAIVPCLGAAAAIAIGGLALAVPGLLLLVLLSLTGASPKAGVTNRLADSIAVARAHLPAAALAALGMLVIDAAIGLVAYRVLVAPLSPHPSPAQLAGIRDFVRAIAIGLVVASPLPATVLATLRSRAEPYPHTT